MTTMTRRIAVTNDELTKQLARLVDVVQAFQQQLQRFEERQLDMLDRVEDLMAAASTLPGEEPIDHKVTLQ